MVDNQEDGDADCEYSIPDVQKYCEGFLLEEEGFCRFPGIFEGLSVPKIAEVVHEKCTGRTEKNEPIITPAVHLEILEALELMAVKAACFELAAEGFLECRWDEKMGEWVFRRKDSPRKYRKRKRRKNR